MLDTPTTRERLYFADWLRIAAFGLLVLYHVGMLYVPWGFHIKHSPTYAALEPWMRLTNPWRMSLLFVVSGLASGMMLGREDLLRERAKRLLLPLVFGMAVVVPTQSYFEVQEKLGYAGSYLDFLHLYLTGYHGFCKGTDCLRLPTWNHLWFLPYLFIYTALLVAALRWLPKALLPRAASALARLAGWRLIVWPVAIIGLVRVLLLPRFGDTHALIDDWFNHVTYGAMFAFGVVLARRRVLLERFEALRWPALGAALAAWAALCVYFAVTRNWPEVPELFRLPMRLVFASEQWCAIVAAFGFARRHLDADHRWRKPLTEAVFPLYIVHQTIIIGGAVALRPLALPAGAEALLLVTLTFACGLASWLFARRVGWLRPWMGMNAIRRPARASRPLPA